MRRTLSNLKCTGIKKWLDFTSELTSHINNIRTKEAKRGVEDGDDRLTFDPMMTRAPMGTTLPACTLTHNGSALVSSLSLHSLLLLLFSCVPLSCQWNSLSWSEGTPLCCCFSGRLPTVFFLLFQALVNMLKFWATLATSHWGSSAGPCRNRRVYAHRGLSCEKQQNTFCHL